jgi:hypothetical protein
MPSVVPQGREIQRLRQSSLISFVSVKNGGIAAWVCGQAGPAEDASTSLPGDGVYAAGGLKRRGPDVSCANFTSRKSSI